MKNIIVCPKCGTKIDVNEVLYKQIEREVKIKYDDEFKKKIEIEKEKIEKEAREKIENEMAEYIKELKKEIMEKTEKIKEYYKLQAEYEKIKREKEELKERIIFEKEKEFSQRISEEREKLKKELEEKFYFELKEKEKTIEDLKKELKEAQEKAEKISIGLKGEIQEIEIEKFLKIEYPFDEIKRVRKGEFGADVIQIVKNEKGVECGKIYYESKRTKNFDNKWIAKLKEDNLNLNADFLVIVTETMPKESDRFFYKDGVWICNFFELKPLSFILRYFLIEMSYLKISREDKETKMAMLYDYLTGNEFKNQFGAFIDGFTKLYKGYIEERKRMQSIWAEREKDLQKILDNLMRFYGSIKAIAGEKIPEIKELEDKKFLMLEGKP
ncbi:MAG: DUF2130 domain-containing protein [candidate division WOR-3 bacterium]